MFSNRQTETDNFFDLSLAFNLENTVITPKLEYGNQERVGGSSYGDGIISVDGDLSDTSLRGNYYGSPDDYGKNTYTQASIRIDHEFNENWKARLTVKNLFDQSRIYSGTSLQQLKTNDPRSINFSFDYSF